jgi:hypothetical protein
MSSLFYAVNIALAFLLARYYANLEKQHDNNNERETK